MATFDVCIVGAGPHALAVLSALHTPNAKLSEDKHMRRARGQGARGKPLSSTTKTTVCVVDPSGEWLHQWNERFAALGIQYLRSPSWAHPDMFSSESLAEFAWREGRTDELRNVDSSLGALSGMPDLDAGYFRLPGTQLFHDFCAEMTETLPHTFVKGKAVDVITAGDTHEILVQTPQAPLAKIRAKQVVLALGAAGAPNVPRAFRGPDRADGWGGTASSDAHLRLAVHGLLASAAQPICPCHRRWAERCAGGSESSAVRCEAHRPVQPASSRHPPLRHPP